MLHSIIRYTSKDGGDHVREEAPARKYSYVDEERDDRRNQSRDKELQAFYDLSRRRGEAVSRIRNRIEWLPAIDIDPIPPDFDLVTSVLVRIWDSAKRHGGGSQRGFAADRGQHTFTEAELEAEYSRLLVDASCGWQGGLLGARKSTEPELFAGASEELAKSNLGFSRRFNRFLEGVAELYFGGKTVFVLPIDDTDLKPPRGVEVLKLIRMLHSPRLFVIAMGDIELFELVSSLDMMRELGFREHMDRQSLLPVNADTVRRHVSSITATALRKLIPLDQRMELTSYDVMDGLSFCPHGATTPLYHLLQAIPIVVDEHMRNTEKKQQGDSESESAKPEGTLRPSVGDQYLSHTNDDNKQSDSKSDSRLQKMSLQMSLFDFLFPELEQPQNGANSLSEKEKKTEDMLHVREFAEMVRARSDWATVAKNAEEKLKRLNDNSSAKDYTSLGPHIRYFGRRCLESSARRIADVWFSIHRLQRSTERLSMVLTRTATSSNETDLAVWAEQYRQYWDDLLAIFRKLCRHALMEESVLDVSHRELIDRAFDDHSGSVDWSDMPLTLRPMFHKGRSVTRKSRSDRIREWFLSVVHQTPDKTSHGLDLTVGTTIRYYFNPPATWTVETGSADVVRSDVRRAMLERRDYFNHFDHRPISTDTAAMLSLYHDLLQFSYRGESFFPHFVDMSVYEGLPWAYTAFETSPQNKCIFYWPAPPCVSVFGLDYFARLWGQATKSGGHIGVHRSVVLWILFGTATVTSSSVSDETFGNCVRRAAIYSAEEPEPEKADRFRKRVLYKSRAIEKMARTLTEKDTPGVKEGEANDRRKACWRKLVAKSDLRKVLFRRFEQIGSCSGEHRTIEYRLLAGSKVAVRLLEDREANPQRAKKERFLNDIRELEKTSEVCRMARAQLNAVSREAMTLARERPEADISRNHREWLLSVITLLMPEFGVSGILRQELLFGMKGLDKNHGIDDVDDLIRFICEHRRAVRSRRARRLAKLVWLGHPHLAVRLAFADPNLYGMQTRLSQRSFFRAFHLIHDNHDEISAGLFWFNGDSRVRESLIVDFVQNGAPQSVGTQWQWHWELQKRFLEQCRPEPLPASMVNERGEPFKFNESGESQRRLKPEPDRSLEEVVERAAMTLAEWDSSTDINHHRDFRAKCLRRLYRLQDAPHGGKDRSAGGDRNEITEVENDFHIWQRLGRSLTPSVEEIESAGATVYGADRWEDVSLKKFGYDLDFAEQSYYRR
ncbi:MAG: hypothetical protein KDA89_04950 [Planctomycetaceae bacterium]|nr:hypothetical protein [Planctomycetaceae bacterium]